MFVKGPQGQNGQRSLRKRRLQGDDTRRGGGGICTGTGTGIGGGNIAGVNLRRWLCQSGRKPGHRRSHHIARRIAGTG